MLPSLWFTRLRSFIDSDPEWSRNTTDGRRPVAAFTSRLLDDGGSRRAGMFPAASIVPSCSEKL